MAIATLRLAQPVVYRRIAALLAMLWLALLQACGGAAGDAASPAPAASLPELSGSVSNGWSATQVAALQITVKGHVGTARTAEGRPAATAGGDYLASLDQLSGPYLLSDSAAASDYGLYAVASGPGTANLTPLTTLLVAELLGAEPGAYFAALGNRGGFSGPDEASIAAAEQRVRRYLKREYGFDVPAAVGHFVTTPFSRSVGDPMFDTISALVARIGSGADYRVAVTALAQESARCKLESLSLDASAQTYAFCPFAKANEADADDATVQQLSFSNRRGDRLVVRLRGASVLAVQRTSAEGATSACRDAACSGVTVGTPAADLTQTIAFAATPLRGDGGSLALSGSLRTSVPGVTLPGLACTSNRFYLIDAVARSAQGYCTTADDFGLGASGQSLPSGATRRNYSFNDGAGGPSVELVTEGRTVLRVLVYTSDADTGATTPRFQCRGAACAGVTLDAPTVDNSLGVAVVLQPIRVERAVLAAVQADGSLSTSVAMTLQASFTGWYINDASALPLLPVACAAAAPTTLVLPSDQSRAIAVCEPDANQGFQLRSSSIDGTGNLVLSAANLLSDGAGNYTAGNSISVTLSPAAALLAVQFEQFDGPRYQCAGLACSGVVVSGPDALGQRTITLGATLLQEIGTAGLKADRSATLNGSMLAPPLP